MLIRRIGFRVRGFYNVASSGIKESSMSLSARQKRDALVFWEKHGLAATMDHTGYSRFSRYAGRRLPCPGARTIGRLVAAAPDKMRCTPLRLGRKGRPKPLKRKLRPRLGRKGCTAIPGHCVAFDTVLHFINGCRQSIFTAIDHASRFRFAFATNGINSRHATRFASLSKRSSRAPSGRC